jgi:hypothetical protein
MPAKTEKQRRFMQAVAHSKEFAKKVDVPQSVGREFTMAEKLYPDQGKKKDKK